MRVRVGREYSRCRGALVRFALGDGFIAERLAELPEQSRSHDLAEQSTRDEAAQHHDRQRFTVQTDSLTSMEVVFSASNSALALYSVQTESAASISVGLRGVSQRF